MLPTSSAEFSCPSPGVECIYEDKRLKGGIKTGVIERLTQRIDTIENMFMGQGILLQQLLQAKEHHSVTEPRFRPQDSFSAYTENLKRTFCAAANNANEKMSREEAQVSEGQPGVSGLKRRRRDEYAIPFRASQVPNDPSFVDMCGLIPPSKELATIVDKYFEHIHPWVPVLHPATFRQRMRDPDRHEGLTIINRAIVAVASHLVPISNGPDSSQQRQKMRQYASECRQNVITSAIEGNSKESIQAVILIAFDSVRISLLM
ncbi:hypothetical protein QQS21_002603 [Conoideocrella luteorostrata]|uniref:Xylanolytic transcriptional activator regulatory domain-containing protein n=1 Tax=Conoideocrella luteorostrata TaxID=1105319 RepID=A0AAJ0CXS9_9HYPO|nr:hypothetical protein QQS21_002603 [Conoideocrella luteorostrata]